MVWTHRPLKVKDRVRLHWSKREAIVAVCQGCDGHLATIMEIESCEFACARVRCDCGDTWRWPEKLCELLEGVASWVPKVGDKVILKRTDGSIQEQVKRTSIGTIVARAPHVITPWAGESQGEGVVDVRWHGTTTPERTYLSDLAPDMASKPWESKPWEPKAGERVRAKREIRTRDCEPIRKGDYGTVHDFYKPSMNIGIRWDRQLSDHGSWGCEGHYYAVSRDWVEPVGEWKPKVGDRVRATRDIHMDCDAGDIQRGELGTVNAGIGAKETLGIRWDRQLRAGSQLGSCKGHFYRVSRDTIEPVSGTEA